MTLATKGFGTKTHGYTLLNGYETTRNPNAKEPARGTPARSYKDSEILRELDAHEAEKSRKKMDKFVSKHRPQPGAAPSSSMLSRALTPTADDSSHHEIIDSYFRNLAGDGAGAIDNLKTAIAQAIPATASPGDTEAFRALLSLSLARVCGDQVMHRSPVRAQEILACLRGMDLVGIIRGTAQMPVKSDGTAYSVSVQRAAWSMAYQLAADNSIAYNALDAALDTKIPAGKKRVLKKLLESCFHMVELRQGGQRLASDRSPASLLAEAQARRTLVGDAVQGNHAVLCSAEGPSKAWKTLAANNPRLAIASNAVRNGHYSDEHGTAFAKAAARSNKVPVWKERALERKRKQDEASAAALRDGDASAADESGEGRQTKFKQILSKVKHGAVGIVAPGLNKDPMTPLLEQATILKNAHENALDESKKVVTVLSELRCAQKDWLCAILHEHGKATAGEQKTLAERKQLTEAKQELCNSLVKIAVLEVFEKRNIMHRLQASPLSPEETQMVNRRLTEMANGWVEAVGLADRVGASDVGRRDGVDEIAEAGPSNTEFDLSSISQKELEHAFSSLMRHSPKGVEQDPVVLTPEVIEEWAVDVRGKLMEAVIGDASSVSANWDRMEAALERWKGKVPEVEIPSFMTEDEFDDAILGIMGGLELGSSAKGIQGWTTGGDTSILSKLLSADSDEEIEKSGEGEDKGALELAEDVAHVAVNVVAAGVVVPRFKATGSREVFFNLELSAQALGVSFGSQIRGNVELGVYGRVGPNIAIDYKDKTYGVLAGGSGGIVGRYEEVQPNGVLVLRMGGRTGRNWDAEAGGAEYKIAPGMNGDTARKAEFVEPLRALLSPVTADERNRGISTPLHRAMLTEDVSVTYQQYGDMPERKGKVMGGLGVGGIFRYGHGRVGLNVAELRPDWIKELEAFNVMEEKQGATRIYRETGLTAWSVGVATGAVAGAGDDEVVVGGVPLSYKADFFNRLMMARRNIIIENNDVQASSYLQLAHQSFDGFAQSVLGRLDEWAESVIRRRIASVPEDLRPAIPPAGTDLSSDDNMRTYRDYIALKEDMKTTVRSYLKAKEEKENSGIKSATYTHSEWLTLNPARALEANKHMALKSAANLLGEREEARKQDKAAKTILRNPDSYVPTLLFGLKTLAQPVVTGPNLGIVSQRYRSIETTTLTDIDG